MCDTLYADPIYELVSRVLWLSVFLLSHRHACLRRARMHVAHRIAVADGGDEDVVVGSGLVLQS